MSKTGKKENKKDICVILCNIRSAQNVGSIFRTSDAAGIFKIYLVGLTPDPVDKFGRARKDISKVALGAETNIRWQHENNIKKLISDLKKEGALIVAVEQAEKSTDYKKIKTRYPLAFIIGNEVEGIPREILKQCDYIAEIPMRGRKESLNVSVAFGIALFRILNI